MAPRLTSLGRAYRPPCQHGRGTAGRGTDGAGSTWQGACYHAGSGNRWNVTLWQLRETVDQTRTRPARRSRSIYTVLRAIRASTWTWAGCARCASTAARSSAAPRRCRPPHGQEGVAGRLAAARHHLHGPDDPGRRRHAGHGAAAVRQGAPAGARTTARRARRRPTSTSPSARSASITTLVPYGGRGAGRLGHSRSRRSRPAFPPGSVAVRRQARARSRRRSPPAPSEIDIVITRAHVLTGDWQALYDEVARLPRGLRRRAHEDHPRHRRAGHAAQRRARASLVCMMAGADFIKTSTGKESRQRHPAGQPGHGRAPSATTTSAPASRSASSRPAASDRQAMRSTG